MLTGGQDDLISIWSVVDSAIVARCQGHQSWVTSVAFDPWRCDDRNYRFGSVGEDCRLCLWDFNVGMLHRPKAVRFVWAPDFPASSREPRRGGVRPKKLTCQHRLPFITEAPYHHGSPIPCRDKRRPTRRRAASGPTRLSLEAQWTKTAAALFTPSSLARGSPCYLLFLYVASVPRLSI